MIRVSLGRRQGAQLHVTFRQTRKQHASNELTDISREIDYRLSRGEWTNYTRTLFDVEDLQVREPSTFIQST